MLLTTLAQAVTAGSAKDVAGQFSDGLVNWEVYLTRPSGGVLLTPEDVRSFLSRLRADGSQWRVVDLYPPTGDAGLPDSAVYGASLSITDRRGSRTSPMKLVVDCDNGGITRAVGPDS